MIINYVSKNFQTKDQCIKALMSFYHLHKDTMDIDELASFNTFIDMKLGPLQMTLSTLYLFIESGLAVEAINLYEEQVKCN